MQFYYSSPQDFPKTFSWLTETGILISQVCILFKTHFLCNILKFISHIGMNELKLVLYS